MERETSAVGFDIQARKVERARRGEWPGIRAILREAVNRIRGGQSLHEESGRFLAEALEKAQEPGQEISTKAAKLLRLREPLPSEIAGSVERLLEHILGKMEKALIQQKEHIKKQPVDCKLLFSPNSPPPHHFLDLETQIATAFRLKKEADRGGRPPQDRPTDQLFDTFETLRGYGAGRIQAQKILAHRFGVDLRTIQRKFEERSFFALEEREGQKVLVHHEPGQPRPEQALGDGPVPFEPYLKARLATAVSKHLADGDSLKAAIQRVAEEFGLHVDREHFGRDIVRNAVELCNENQSGWAKVPLAVCRHEADRDEADRSPQIWPTPESVAESTIFAAEIGESPALIDAVSRDLYRDIPTMEAVDDTAKEFGLSFDQVMEMCRRRIDLGTLK